MIVRNINIIRILDYTHAMGTSAPKWREYRSSCSFAETGEEECGDARSAARQRHALYIANALGCAESTRVKI